MNTNTTVAQQIVDGALDDQLDRLQSLINSRRDHLRSVRAASLSIGDRVRTVDLRPKYMSGLVGTIVEFDGDRAKVEFSASDARNRGRYIDPVTHTSNVPAKCLAPLG